MSASEEAYLQEVSCKFHAKAKKKKAEKNYINITVNFYFRDQYLLLIASLRPTLHLHSKSHRIRYLYPGTKRNSYKDMNIFFDNLIPRGHAQIKIQSPALFQY